MGGFIWQVGGYYFRQKLFYAERAFDGLTIVSNVLHNNRNRNYGLFASGEYKVSPGFTLRAGVRYSNDKKRDIISGVAQLPAVTLPVTNRVSDDNVSWDLSATYTIAPDVNIYARFATGYLGPAIQDRVNFFSVPSTAGKQTTISGEAGIKGALDGGLNFSFDGYWYRTKNLQLTAVGGANNSARLLSADKAVGYGLEAELSYTPVENLALTLSGSYNHTEIKDPGLGVAPCGGGCTVLDPTGTIGTTTVAFIDGNPLPQAPRWVFNATLRSGIPINDTDEVFFYTDWAYRSSINYFLYEAAEFRGRSLLEGGARVGYRTGGLELAVFARNITDQIRSISAIDFNNLTGMINEPRIIGGEIRFSY
jgi:iron complex outermembrane receptor protein